jgi:hypothetical protein
MTLNNDFQPSDKYVIMTRDKYNELKMQLERIRTAITVQTASDTAGVVLDELKKKYDRPAYADALQAELEKKAAIASNQGNK